MNELIKYSQLAGIILLSCVIGLCLFLDGAVGTERVQKYMKQPKQPKQIGLGIVAQHQFVANRMKINRMMAEIKKLQIEDGELLRSVLKANNIVLKPDEQCGIDLKTWKLHFSKNKEGLK